MRDDIYHIELTELTDEGWRQVQIPVYTCGHCSQVVRLRNDRTRERVDCLSCGRIICEKSKICRTHCTPIHRLADNMEMGDAKWGKYIPAIMQGITDPAEAEARGLINV